MKTTKNLSNIVGHTQVSIFGRKNTDNMGVRMREAEGSRTYPAASLRASTACTHKCVWQSMVMSALHPIATNARTFRIVSLVPVPEVGSFVNLNGVSCSVLSGFFNAGELTFLDTRDDETRSLRSPGEQEDYRSQKPFMRRACRAVQPSPLAHPAHTVPPPGREGGDVGSRNQPGRSRPCDAHTM